MTEAYPAYLGGELVVTICGGDASLICSSDWCRYYLWVSPSKAIDVTELMVGNELRVGSASLPIKSWVEGVPYVHAVTINELSNYVREVARRVKDVIEGKEVILGFSGGKDSVAALYVIKELMNYVDFKLRVIYVHIPYLEGKRNLEFVREVSKVLNVDIEVVEVSRRLMRKNLKWYGMPRRGFRWCTYLKVRPIRRLVRGSEGVIEALADRLFESLKRAWRLMGRVESGLVASKKRFLPVQSLTILDVIKLNNELGIKHPAYDEGLPRVSCDLCPFKVLYELGSNYLDKCEDPGVIELAIRRSWRVLRESVSFSDYVDYALWRFSPRVAKSLYKVRSWLSSTEGLEWVGSNYFRELIKYVWSNLSDLRLTAKYLSSKELIDLVRYGLKEGLRLVRP